LRPGPALRRWRRRRRPPRNKKRTRARDHVRDEARKEALVLEVRVVLLHLRLRRLHELHRLERVPLRLEALDDLANEAALHAVGLDHDVFWRGGWEEGRKG
jgi:hypothetical protein